MSDQAVWDFLFVCFVLFTLLLLLFFFFMKEFYPHTLSMSLLNVWSNVKMTLLLFFHLTFNNCFL